MITTPAFTYSLTNLYIVFTCLVCDMVVILFTINIAPTLLTLTITGSLTKNLMLPSSWIRIITSFTVSDKATHSAYVLNCVTLFLAFDHRETYTSKTCEIKPLMILLLTGSLAQYYNLSKVFPMVCLNSWLVQTSSFQYIITHSVYLNAAGFAFLFAFDTSLIMLTINSLDYFIR